MKALAVAAALFVAVVALVALPVGIGFVVGYVKESRNAPPPTTIHYCTPDSTDARCISAWARRADGGLGVGRPLDGSRHEVSGDAASVPGVSSAE